MSQPKRYFPSKLLNHGSTVAGFSFRLRNDEIPLLADEAGFSTSAFYMATQVHGNRVITVDESMDSGAVESVEADALVTNVPGYAVAVRTADCVPVLMSAGNGEAVAAVHAGWRGLVAGVIGAAAERLSEMTGADVGSFRAAIGPAIDGCCFEVGPEVAEQISAAVASPSVVIRDGDRRPYVDLRGAASLALERAGFAKEKIELVGPCTRCAASLLHSYRREGPGKGRQISFVYVARGRGEQDETGYFDTSSCALEWAEEQ